MGTGFRAGELSSLRPESFDLNVNSPTATIEAAYAKNRQQAVQPLPLDLAEALRGYLADKPKGKAVWPGTWADDAAEMLRTDLETAGIPYRDEDARVLDFHGLRHSFITLMAQSGIHPKLAQTLARHSTITLTMDRYAHVRLYDQAEALTALPSFLPQASMREAGASAATGTDGICPEKGSRRLDRALTKPVMSGGPLVITPASSSEAMANVDLLRKSSQPKGIERDCDPVIAPGNTAPYRTRTYNPLIKRR